MNTLTRMGAMYLRLSVPLWRRGFRTFMSMLIKFLPDQAKELCTAKLDDGRLFSFAAGDAYWQYYFLTGKEYEREIRSFIRAMPKAPEFFVDGGANFGFWSKLLSKNKIGRGSCRERVGRYG